MRRKKMGLEMKAAPPLRLLFTLAFILPCSLSDDAETLLSFKSSLPNPKPLSSWQPGKSPCEFAGVSCSSSSAPRVTALDLSSLPLSPVFASVSAHLFPLQNLTSLNLKSTNLSGPIGPVGSCSPSLTHLDLSLNSLSGSPSAMAVFSACSALASLNLSSNQIDSSPSSIHGSYSLGVQILDLSSNQLAGSAFLPWLLTGGCPHLTNLTVKGNKLGGSFSLDGCDSLLHFDVSSNNFSSPMPGLGGCHQLKHLDLSSNRFSGPIGDELGGCEQLTYLNVSANRFAASIPSLPTSNLRRLYMSDNQFEGGIDGGGGGILDSCPNLVELDLSLNHLSGNLPTGLESCSSLTLFDVSTNNFTGDLPIAMLMKMSGLKKLLLASNNFVGVLPEPFLLPTGLESLDLSSNHISGQIPSGLCQSHRTHLTELYLQDNLLSGGIPSDLGNCTQLVSLDLSFNYLTGKIPPSLGLLSRLKDLIMWMNQLDGGIPQDLMYARSLENLVLDYNRLTGTIPSGLRNCTNLNWISLSSNRLSGVIPSWIGGLANLAILQLSNNSFQGRIPGELGECKSLLWLDLNSNLLDGPIPSTLSKQSGNMAVGLVVGKKYVYLKNDGSSSECPGAGSLLEFAGIRQESLSRIPTRHSCNFTRIYRGNTQPTFQHNGTMIFLDLSYNMLQGSVPKELGSMYYLSILDLAHNSLSGPIPSELGGLKYVGVMDLSYNRLSGPIPPSLAGLTLLTEIDLSNNNLTGMIPDSGQFETFPPYRFYNNSGLCGYPLPRCRPASAAAPGSQQQRQRRSRGSLAGSVAMGLLLSLFCILGAAMLYRELRKRSRRREPGSDDGGELNTGARQASWKLTSAREALSISLAAFEKPLRKLTFADLLEATNGFHDDTLVGSGGFGDVYKAELKDGSVVAIKKLIQISGQGDREFTAEMETIGRIKHRNLVPLLGYCKVREERLLVYEYMQHGSLDDALHRGRVGLRWGARRRIAIGAARGLAFLHHNCIPHIIHRDMKSSNVLLDGSLDARVSDFGMARLMSALDTHLSVSTLAGTPGYVPPEYYQSFRCSTKGDVYSYGVVLLELLTGRPPTDSADFGDNNNLVGWVKMRARARVSDVFDPELLQEDPGLEMELLQHLKVACACLDDRPWRRPTMIQVMAMFKEIQAGPGGLDSADSTIATDDTACFSSVDGVDITINEDPEYTKF